ncbi:hypothetical protein PAECIP111893_03633 [Paenibacillus plantiphilus]|uniref:Type I restriction modification DNA specificity domain-containing protein n=1 Tax=Paenibacillus plantiphilus TaxID=2905650 RepID=A0ABN8GPV2_9BACL|nr:restriction endonuclease subunit S [Paenibacillus plantiphilus]CAH1213117.1 hypothetical protein PAECIP111893_03633 [Paenibacillus plantiphilus]
MSKWEMVRWSEIVEIKNGRNQKAVEDSNGRYPIYGSGGVMGYANDFLCNEDTVIIGRKGNINKPIYVSEKFWNVDTAFGLSPKNNMLSSKFLYYFCIKFNFEKLNTTVTIPSLTKSNLLNIKIPLPPIEKQKHIAKTLDIAAELLAMRKQQLAELDNLIKSTFYDMFGDPVVNEKGWHINRLSDCMSIIGGYAFKSTDFSDDGIPVIKIGNINSGIFNDKGISFWKHDRKLEKYSLLPKDVVISLTGTVGKDDYANVCILPDSYPKYYLNQRNAKLELNKNIVVYYLLYLLRDTKIKGKLTGISRGIRQANISNSDITALMIPLPPIELQNQFANIVTKIEEQKALVKKAIDETQYLFDSLMSEYFE